MKLNDRLMSFIVEPGANNPRSSRIDISFFKNGKFLVSESPTHHMDDAYKEISSCIIGDKEQFASIVSFLKKARDEFSSAPEDSLFGEYEGSEYYLCLDGHLSRGSLAITDEKIIPKLSKSDERKARWNNKVVDFTRKWNDLISVMEIKGYPLNEPDELYLLSPRSLFLLNRARKSLGESYESASLPEAIKKSAKLAFYGKSLPIGDKRFRMEKAMKSNLLSILKDSHSKAEFDKAFTVLCKEIASYDADYDFCDIANWMNMAYLLLLLHEEEIVDERKISFLHPPINKAELLYFHEKANQSSYKQEVKKKRLLSDGYSPIYKYLTELLDIDEHFNERWFSAVNAS